MSGSSWSGQNFSGCSREMFGQANGSSHERGYSQIKPFEERRGSCDIPTMSCRSVGYLS